MAKPLFIAAVFVFCISFTACNRSKPKPVSANITKTAVLVNGKKDSVINNLKKNYGNATVSEPCIKCLIQVIQVNENYKLSTAGTPVKKIIYVIDWVRPSPTRDTDNLRGATNGLKLDVFDKGEADEKLSSFLYDNSTAKIYYVINTINNNKVELAIDAASLKRIRNACYWGVASAK